MESPVVVCGGLWWSVCVWLGLPKACSKAMATVITFPMQTMRTLSARGEEGKKVNGSGSRGAKHAGASGSYAAKLMMVWSQIMSILKTDGVGGFYNGFETKVVQSSLSAAILFVVRLQLLQSLKPHEALE